MTETFFLDIFNKIFKINEKEVMIFFDKNNEIWFGLVDILKALNYSNYNKARKEININKKFMKKYENISNLDDKLDIPNLQPNKIFINESGLYELLTQSNKILAKRFKDKYFTEIMPTIRKTGKFIMDSKDKNKLEEMNKKINDLQIYNKRLLNNQKNFIYPNGLSLYIIKQIIDTKKYYKIGITQNLNTRLFTYNTGNANKIYYDYYIPIQNKIINKCLKENMKNYEYIKNKEFYNITLIKIFNFIIKCDKKIKYIFCGYCHKRYFIHDFSHHNCILK